MSEDILYNEIRDKLRIRCRERCAENKFCETCEIFKSAKLIGVDLQPSDCVEYVAVKMIIEERRKRSI